MDKLCNINNDLQNKDWEIIKTLFTIMKCYFIVSSIGNCGVFWGSTAVCRYGSCQSNHLSSVKHSSSEMYKDMQKTNAHI